MSFPPELENVASFLEEYRACAGNYPTVHQSLKNRKFFEESGIDFEQIMDILRNKLNNMHLHSGPELEKDKNHLPGVIYKFLYPWKEYLIYIKLKIPEDPSLRLHATICLSFHEEKDI